MNKQSLQIILLFLLYSLVYFCLSTVIYYISILEGYKGLSLPFFGGADDGVFYYDQALNVLYNLPYILSSVHSLVLGYLLKFFQTESVFLLRMFNYLGSLLLMIISLFLLNKEMYQNKSFQTSAVILILVFCFYPSLLLINTLSIFRDIWIYFYFITCTYFFANLFIFKSKWPFIINFCLLLSMMFLLGSYRKYALLSFMIASFIFLVLSIIDKKNIKFRKFILFTLTSFTIFYLCLKSYKFPYINLSFQDVLAYRQSGLDIYSGGSQMWISLDQPNIVLFYLNYFYSMASNFIGPFPWQITGFTTLILMVTEGFLFLMISIFLFRRRKLFSEFDKYLLMQSLIWFMLISISNDNFGTGSRLRIVGWLPLLILFAKYYGEKLFQKKNMIS